MTDRTACNRCGAEWDGGCVPTITVDGATLTGCPTCKTDDYLMDADAAQNAAEEAHERQMTNYYGGDIETETERYNRIAIEKYVERHKPR